MDIPKYIGLFLLKNRFCYIHGLGNLEIKKRPATHDGQTLKQSPYEVQITPAGSIDDNLANFIATNEQTSISKASNALREFSTQARLDLAAGKEVVIPFIGKFVEEGSKVSFITDPQLQYTAPGMPVLKHARTEEEVIAPSQDKKISFPEPAKVAPQFDFNEHSSGGGTVNWVRISIVAVILIIMITGVVFGIRYINSKNDTATTESATTTTAAKVTQPVMQAAPKPDTTAQTMQHVDSTLTYNMIIGTYHALKDAEKRERQLKSYGHDVQITTKDSTSYFIIIPIECKPADTTHIKDSLKIFEPKGVSILK